MTNDPRAGQPATADDLVDVDELISAYYELRPNISESTQKVAFGTSGHRGSSLKTSFNDDHIAATSKTFRSLARLTGAAPSSEGIRVHRELSLPGLRQLIGFISHMSSKDLATLEGVSATRAHQLLAGAIVAESAMRHLDAQRLEICPWALREGVILRRLDVLDGA